MRLIDADLLEPDADYDDGEFWAYSKVQIDNAPTVTPERKRGRWKFEDKYVNRYDDTIEIRRCSNCGFKHYYCQGNTALTDDAWFNYCPNCGCRMMEVEHERK